MPVSRCEICSGEPERGSAAYKGNSRTLGGRTPRRPWERIDLVSLMLSTPADAERRRRLRVMRGVALSLLILAAAIFVATLRLDH